MTDAPFAQFIRGRDGVALSDVWQGSPQAYRGAAVPGFPNMFWLIGPNTGLGHSSMVFMIESHLNYVMSALEAMERGDATRIEVRRDVYDAYNDDIQARLGGTVWNTGGCSSWYLDRNGRNSTIWPDFTWRFWQQTRRFDEAAYMATNGSGRALDGPTRTLHKVQPLSPVSGQRPHRLSPIPRRLPVAAHAPPAGLGPLGVQPLADLHRLGLELVAAVLDQLDHRVDVRGHLTRAAQ